MHVRRLRAKLGAEHEAMIGTVRNVGYRFVPQNIDQATMAVLAVDEVDIGLSWQSTINAVNSTETLVRGIKPIEGTTGWVNNWMISNATKSINCSYKWIDWMISPQTNALTAEWFGEAPSNRDACALTADKRHCALFNAQDEKFWSDIYYWEYPQTKCLDGRTEIQCVGYEDWFLTWTNFRNS